MPSSEATSPADSGPPDSGSSGSGASPWPERHAGTSRLEWGVAAVSALVVLAVVGFLLAEGLGEPPTPPEVHVTATAVRPLAIGHLVEFEAANRGGTTAARVEVEGTLRRGGATVETASATLDYVPEDGSRRGGLYFSADPRAHALELRATGYARP